MEKLSLGKVKSADLAQWFGISYSRYRHNKQKYLSELIEYCQYEEIYGGVLIKEIYNEIYQNFTDLDDQVYLQHVLETKNKLMSVTGLSRVLLAEDTRYQECTMDALIHRMRNAGTRLFGITKEPESCGPAGSREYIWAIKLSDFNEYRFMTEEETNLFRQKTSQFYNNPREQKKWEDGVKLKAQYRTSSTKDKHAIEQLILDRWKDDNDYYKEVIKPVNNYFNIIIVCATYHEVAESILKQNGLI